MVLYGVAATLFAYCVSLVVDSPLAAFAATAGVEIVLFIVGTLHSVDGWQVAHGKLRYTWRHTCSS
jgi:hypothetical protein